MTGEPSTRSKLVERKKIFLAGFVTYEYVLSASPTTKLTTSGNRISFIPRNFKFTMMKPKTETVMRVGVTDESEKEHFNQRESLDVVTIVHERMGSSALVRTL